ncbi:hypothetical protein [Pontibacillus litoralis]|uniref:Uncharacterized protein n=1 Tax=Pontibacillus litoralis JSM 072002 TaxID=1385512 RepID=A0A0A5G7S8_9BACI|nr:hypothetical protein [Pontibacillus litoralis]KGX89196.1 hypothetical protein N784_01200 [Pontibacillus litoralis JSM 072002]
MKESDQQQQSYNYGRDIFGVQRSIGGGERVLNRMASTSTLGTDRQEIKKILESMKRS